MSKRMTIAFSPRSINDNGTLLNAITTNKNTVITANPTMPWNENTLIINSSVANNFVRGSNLWMTESAG